MKDFPKEISSHDDLCSQLATLLNESIQTLFPNVNIRFGFRPNGADEYSDLYYSIICNKKVVKWKLVAEVQTINQVDFKCTNIIDE